jgi:RHS repeat-associated protein
VWSWDNTEPFGDSVASENPSGLGAFTCNLRFPGQYFDKETNTHYNYFRDYHPAIGRYVQSDPIGLDGGIHSYVYVGSNPLSRVDSTGEFFFIPGLIALVTSGGGATAATAIGATAVVGGLIYSQSQSPSSRSPSVDPLTGTRSSGSTGSNCPPDDPCKGLRRQLEEHEDKLRRYVNDPYANDPKGFLNQGRDPQVMAGRVRNLQRQVANFKKLLEECERKNGMRN